MTSDLKGILPLSNKLTPTAQQGFCLHGLRTGTLVALAQLCDDDCIGIFTKHDVNIIKHDEVIIQGSRAPNGLWTIPINTQSTHQINGILRLDQTKKQSSILSPWSLRQSCSFHTSPCNSQRQFNHLSRSHNYTHQ